MRRLAKAGLFVGKEMTMRLMMIWGLAIFGSVSTTFAADANTQQKITFTGKVVDDTNRPIEGAKVTFYQLTPDSTALEVKNVTTQEQITKENGGFLFSAESPADKPYRFTIVLARKEKLAIGWENWDMRKDKTAVLTMGEAYTLRGLVVDDSNKPVAGADVRIPMLLIGDPRNGQDKCRYIISTESLDLLKTVTDANGIFAFTDIPIEAKAEFTVNKTGKATISTLNPNQSEYNPGQYTVQSKNIKIMLPIEAKIDGKVVEKDTGKPVSGVRLICAMERSGAPFGAKPVVSKDDGTFTFEGLEEKTYTIQDISPRRETAKWIIKPVKVTAAAGQTASGVILEASQGGLLEVMIKDNEKKPVAGANVYFRAKNNSRGQGAISDVNGITTIRLAPDEYELQGAYKEGYSSPKEIQTVTIEDGKTVRLDIELKGAPKITGTVRNQSGSPVAGAMMRIFPHGEKEISSDKEGKFEIMWHPERWGSQEPDFILIARDIGSNLAAAVDVNESTKIIDVTMTHGVIVTGKVVDSNNKPIIGAQVHINLRVSNFGMYIDQGGIKTDAKGIYEYKALPSEQKYSVTAQADGYGSSIAQAPTEDAVNNVLEIEPLMLKKARISISGIVVDVNDKPLSNVEIFIHGQGQQSRRGITDADGKFTIDKLCEGQVQVNANVHSGLRYMYGNIEANAGDTDVKVIIAPQGQGSMSKPYTSKQPPSLAGKPLPDLKSIGIKCDPNEVKDKAVLVCFVDMEQRPSRHCMTELVKQTQILKEKGITIIAVQVQKADENTLNDWIKQNGISFPFGIIEADPEKTKVAWGVKSLPWLMLTDKNHTITAEGFTISELNEKTGKN